MNRASVVLVVVLLVGGLVGVVFLLGGPGALFGTSGPAEDAPATPSPEKASVGPGKPAGTATPAARGDSAVLFGRPKSERRGVGGVFAQVKRWKDQAPVADAKLTLSGVGNGDERVDRKATTGPGGSGAFDDVPAGDGYVLRVEAAGEPETLVPGVDVEAGRTRDLGVIYVGQKSGLSGRVVDENGKPVAGADVRAFPGYAGLFDLLSNFMDLFTSLDKEPTPLAKTETDAKGEFTIPDLSPGPMIVRATAAGKRQGLASVTLGSDGPAGGPPTIVLEAGLPVAGVVVEASGAPIPGARVSLMAEDMDDPGQILLGRSFATTDDRGAFRLRVDEDQKRLRAFVAVQGFPTAVSKPFAAGDEAVRIVVQSGVRLELSVADARTRAPIPGATIILGVSEGEGGSDMSAGGGLVTATTDAQGLAVMNAPPGRIEMAMVSAPGYASGMAAPGNRRGASGDGDGEADGNPFGAVEHELPEKLEAGHVAKGWFRLAGGYVMKGRVLDPAGHGIAGAEIKASGVMGFGGAPSSARSDAEGRYRLAMTASSMMVVVRASGWVQRAGDRMAMLAAQFGSMSGGKKPQAPAPGSEVERDFTLYPSVTVRGRVVNDKDEGVAGAEVGLADGGGMGLSMLFGGKDAQVVTGPDGGFVLYDLDASTGGGEDLMAALVAASGMEAPAPPAAAESAKKKLTLAARAEGYVPGKSEPFEVEGGGTVTAPPIKLGRGMTVVGRVKDAGGNAVRGAKLEVSRKPAEADPMQSLRDMMSGGGSKTQRVEADGSFRVEAVAKGTVTLTASAPDHAPARLTVTVGDAAPEAVELRLPRGMTLAGRVVDRGGRPIANAKVAVTGPEAGGGDAAYVPRVEAQTKDDGTYALAQLPPGRLKVTVRADGKRSVDVVLATGGTAPDVTLEDRPAADPERLKAVKKEIEEVRAKLLDSKTRDDSGALQRRLIELMKEQQELEGEEPDFTPVDVPEDK